MWMFVFEIKRLDAVLLKKVSFFSPTLHPFLRLFLITVPTEESFPLQFIAVIVLCTNVFLLQRN